ncbi:MAG: hypothetical protein KatS3mg023_1698 [Armatimonadota bacterium]|nr:MAG: hypothetical protein KatS3mg023_1698 [Armatimonadota bacterium]
MRVWRMFLFTFGVLLGMASLPVGAQPLDILWVRRHEYNLQSDLASKVGTDAAGNVYVAGVRQVTGSQPGLRLLLVKYSPQGELLWETQYPLRDGTASRPVGLYVHPSGKTHVLLQQPSVGDYVLLTYDSMGSLLWIQSYDGTGGTYQSNDLASALGVDAAGNVYVTGSSEGFYSGGDVTTVKYSADGRALWVRRYSSNFFYYYYLHEAGTAIAVSPAGDVYVVGWVSGTSGQVEWIVLKYDARGNLVWNRRETHPGAPYGGGDTLNPRFALLDNSGNLYVVGDINGSFVVLKYDANGNRLWRTYYSIAGLSLKVNGAQVDHLGNVYVAGTGGSLYPYQSAAVAVNLRPDGAVAWQKVFSWDLLQRVDAAVLDAYGNFWLAGTRQSRDTGRMDNVLWQFSEDGALLREVVYDSSPSMYDESVDIAADPFGNVILAANSGYSTTSYTDTGISTDILLLKYGLRTGLNLQGRAWLGDVAMYPLVISIEADLRQYGGVVRRERIPVDENGRFTLYNVPEGVYDIAFRGAHWLRRVVPQVTVAPGAPEVQVYLVNGDIDGDNEVTLFDFGLLVQAFGSNPYSANWNINADLDMDAEVTLFDFAVIVLNFGEIGDE